MNTFNQMTGSRIFDIFNNGNKPSTSPLENGLYRYVVFHVAGKAINLVNHDRFHVFFFPDAREHFLKLGTP
ncbi:MAG: hypothetical protein M0Z32_08955 [Actinomycetota bacterium]|nr:hypothetical protein [Actinomycetota bacterium]MCL6094069.1 hypothetical protein [Actinomycetota bacterium]MDA8167849.1 hypothetical protein [Actinomycetota bacterium]